LNRTPIAQQLTQRIDKWDHIKLKSFFIAKETVPRLKRQLAERKKIFLCYTTGKGLNNQNLQGAQKTKLPKNQ
jgi:hypothetical protein